MSYLPLILIAAVMTAALLWTAWPWLRHKQGRDKAVTLCLAAGMLALALYLYLGSPFTLQGIAAQQAQHKQTATHIATLEARQQEQGGLSAKDWATLGAAYMTTEQYAQAAEALREAVVASEGEPHLIMAYGKAQMLAADGAITEGAKQAFILAAELLPENPEPRFLLAVERMQAGDKAGAREHFALLLPQLPPQAPLRRVIESRLQEMEVEE